MIKALGCEYVSAVSKKTGKPYKCIFVTFHNTENDGVVRAPVFLAPWDLEKLGLSDKGSNSGTAAVE